MTVWLLSTATFTRLKPQVYLNICFWSTKKQHVFITKIISSIKLWKIIDVYSENLSKLINTLCGQNEELINVEACGTYRNHWALKFNNIFVTPRETSNTFLANDNTRECFKYLRVSFWRVETKRNP